MPHNFLRLVLFAAAATLALGVLAVLLSSKKEETPAHAAAEAAPVQAPPAAQHEPTEPAVDPAQAAPPKSSEEAKDAEPPSAANPEVPGIKYEPLRKAQSEYGPREIDLLHQALRDPAWMSKWQEIAEAIAKTDNSVRGAQAIIEYVKRPDDWTKARPNQQDTVIFRKLNGLAALGLMKGNADAIQTMRKALHPEGMAELAEAWIHDELPGQWRENRQGVITYGRQRAAAGVVLADDPEGIAYVREEYKKLHKEFVNNIGHIPYPSMNAEQIDLYNLYTGLVSALTALDMIRDIGLESYLNLRESGDYMSVYMNYSGAYSFHQQQSEKNGDK